MRHPGACTVERVSDFEQFIDLCVSFPVVIFTTVLIFALAWWLVTTVAGGLDTDGGLDGEGDGFVEDLSDALGAGGVPASISLSVLAFGGWVAALLLTSVVRAFDVSGSTLTAIGIASVVVSLIAGALLLRALAKPLRPLFVTEIAPTLSQAIGSFATVRSPKVSPQGGEVLVTNGPLRSAVLPARAEETFAMGSAVHIVDRDDDGRFVVCPIDPSLT